MSHPVNDEKEEVIFPENSPGDFFQKTNPAEYRIIGSFSVLNQ